MSLATDRARRGDLLPDRPGRVLVQPRPLRRHPLRAALRRRQRPARALRGHARHRLRPRGEAAHHARHLRAGLGLLRRLLPAGAEGADADPARLRRRLRARGRAWSRRPRRPSAFRLGERVQDPLAMYLSDVCTIPLEPRRAARRCRSPAGSPTGCPSGCSSPARPSARTASSTWPTRSRAPSASTRARRGSCERRDAWEPVIGLEIHVQLATRTKMFCGCELSFGDPPNTHTCPVCLAHPGALPVINREAIRLGILAGLALGCEVPPASRVPPQELLLSGPLEGVPDLPVRRAALRRRARRGAAARTAASSRSGITRAHLEEDAAKLVHVGAGGRRAGAEASGVDFNRGGTPLLEIVTEPDLRSAADAGAFLRQLRQTLRAPRRQRLQHGGGLAARRRQRQRAAGRRSGRSAPRPS